MGRRSWFIVVYCFVLGSLLLAGLGVDRAITVMSEAAPPERSICFVIDAGHGGEDGGATSCTGALESNINLDISLRLNDLLHLLGLDTKMIRTTDVSVYTGGNTISARKVSDLKHRVQMVNSTENATLISIHQNYFSDGRYFGAQVFYSNQEDSKVLANKLQKSLIQALNHGSNRDIKPANGIYLMQQVKCPAVLIECGFLSNYQEEAKLRDPIYQKKLCCVIASALSQYANT